MIESKKTSRPMPWLDYDLIDREDEEWRDIAGYDGLYQVSNDGRVKSLSRLNKSGKRLRARILKQSHNGPAAQVGLHEDGIAKTHHVMHLVANAFLPTKADELQWGHRNKVKADNRVSNIRSMTHSENAMLSHQLGLCDHSALNGLRKVDEKNAHEKAFGIYENGIMVAKICYACMKEKPLSAFYRRICSACKKARASNTKKPTAD